MNKLTTILCMPAILSLCFAASAEEEKTESAEVNLEAAKSCYSPDASLSDSSYWSTAAVKLFAADDYVESILTVNACFKQWGPMAGQQQQEMHDTGASCPDTGAADQRTKREIEGNGLINDVSGALWARARSLHALGETEAAKTAYARCMFMTCGRVWDPQGWYWSPAEDCAKQVQELIDEDA